MLKYKRVYICDHCGAIALQNTYVFMGDVWEGPPDGWTKLGREDICPICSEIYERFKNEVMRGENL